MERVLVEIDYTNWRGERRLRGIYPQFLWWGTTAHHKESQFFLKATDAEKNDTRDFAMKDIHSWKQLG